MNKHSIDLTEARGRRSSHFCASQAASVTRQALSAIRIELMMASLMLAFATAAPAAIPTSCGTLATHYGPYDYRTDRNKLGIVESYHFGPEVEALVPSKQHPVGGQLSYTLHAFPNHHRALNALARFGYQQQSEQPYRLPYTITCFFERAIEFRPDDPVVRMLFASYLGRTKRPELAAQQLDMVRKQEHDNPLTVYNLGLLYAEIGRYDQALVQAHLAMQQGDPRVDLKNLLVAKGQWSDPPALPASAPDAAASEPAAAASAPESAASR
jgi:tetratricopeptide (TPR) repeat protein